MKKFFAVIIAGAVALAALGAVAATPQQKAASASAGTGSINNTGTTSVAIRQLQAFHIRNAQLNGTNSWTFTAYNVSPPVSIEGGTNTIVYTNTIGTVSTTNTFADLYLSSTTNAWQYIGGKTLFTGAGTGTATVIQEHQVLP